MKRLPLLVILVLLAAASPVSAEAAARFLFQPREAIADIRVHGNQIATDDEVIALSGVKVGDVVDAQTVTQIGARLRAAHRFQKVEVLKRFASMEDPSQIVIVLIVDEGPVSLTQSKDGGPVTAKRRRGAGNLMFLPIIDSQDGYGLTYGVIVAVPKVGGPRGRLSFPASWGGERKIGAEWEMGLTSRVLTRIEFGSELVQRTNPFYEVDDTRRHVWSRVERAAGPLRLGATGGWQHATFPDEVTSSFGSIGADVAFDTRREPFLARNAVYASASVERLFFSTPSTAPRVPSPLDVNRHRYEARGYLGLFGQSILVLSAQREDSTAPLPRYLKSLLGGVPNLRGFDAGTEAGDTLAAGFAELRLPLTTPLHVGKIGVSAFVDTGATCNYGQRIRDQERKTGVGGAVWVTAAVFHMSFSVAHGLGAHTRAQFDIGFGF